MLFSLNLGRGRCLTLLIRNNTFSQRKYFCNFLVNWKMAQIKKLLSFVSLGKRAKNLVKLRVIYLIWLQIRSNIKMTQPIKILEQFCEEHFWYLKRGPVRHSHRLLEVPDCLSRAENFKWGTHSEPSKRSSRRGQAKGLFWQESVAQSVFSAGTMAGKLLCCLNLNKLSFPQMVSTSIWWHLDSFRSKAELTFFPIALFLCLQLGVTTREK